MPPVPAIIHTKPVVAVDLGLWGGGSTKSEHHSSEREGNGGRRTGKECCRDGFH